MPDDRESAERSDSPPGLREGRFPGLRARMPGDPKPKPLPDSELWKRTTMKPGQSVTLWNGINLKGRVHYMIRNRKGTNKVKLWWVLRPLGSLKKVGFRSGDGSIEIPSPWYSIGATLRAGHADSDTAIVVTEDASIRLEELIRFGPGHPPKDAT